MKKNNKKDELITKEYFHKELDKTLDKRFNEFSNRLDLKFEYFEEKLSKLDTFEKKLDNIMKTLDWLVGKYTKLNDENTVGFEQYRRVDEKLVNHEGRISVLEKKIVYKTS